MSRTSPAATWRGDGAKTKPTASAPMATARRASSSLVMPQILTNTRAGYWSISAAIVRNPATAAAGSVARTRLSPTRTAW